MLNTPNATLSLVSICFSLILILCLAYLVSRALGKTWNKRSSSRYMTVVDQMAVGQDKMILIIEVKGKHYMVGVSAGNMQLITEVDGDFSEENDENKEAPARTASFQDIIGKMNFDRHKKDSGKGRG